MNEKMMASLLATALFGGVPTMAYAQSATPAAAIASSDALSQISMFSYREGPKSHLLFRGTPIAGKAEGSAQVEYEKSNARISVAVERLTEHTSLGPYSVYVLWAVTPDGRAANQGVLAGAAGGSGKLDTQYGGSQFALIVTAEPHFAVTVPSTMIALYNIADKVKGNESKVTTLTERSDYSGLARVATNTKTDSPELVQARYSLSIARTAGAERFAPQEFAKANEKLAAAETAARGDSSSQRKTSPAFAREAVIAGEDARRAAMIGMAAAKAEGERVAAAQTATAAANEAAATAATAATATAAAATTAAAEAAATATIAAAKASTEASAAAANAATEASAVAARAATEASAVAASNAANEASAAATSAERERSAIAASAAARKDLLTRLNAALPTHESNRGLVSSIGGVEFQTGAAEINSLGRESVAKFSGIVASYPGLRFNVEGHTDSTGSVSTNRELSMQRAVTVRDYLIAQGVAASSIDVAGLGSSMPAGDNATSDGRARNRRVEIVLSGGPLAAQ